MLDWFLHFFKICQIRHWPPGGVSEEDNGPKSAPRKSKDINKRGHGISWSSKVTCKTYSKDDPNAQMSFNGNTSTSEGMLFSGHSDSLYDPHAQNEGRGLGSNDDAETFYSTNDNLQNNDRNPQAQQNQPPSSQHFDQYHNTGLDYPNQAPDQMYGDSQNQLPDPTYGDSQNQSDVYRDSQNQDGTSWGEGTESESGSYSHSSRSGSESSATPDSHRNSNTSVSSGSSFSEASSRSQNSDPFNQPEHPNNNSDFVDEDVSSSSRSHSSVEGTISLFPLQLCRSGRV